MKQEMNPKVRYGSQKAADELVKELSLLYELWMQDWPYEVVEAQDIEKYILHYQQTTDEDKRFILMKILIQATEEQPDEERFLKYWNIIQPLLSHDFILHEYTIFYWCDFELPEEEEDDSWKISSLMRNLWKNNKPCL